MRLGTYIRTLQHWLCDYDIYAYAVQNVLNSWKGWHGIEIGSWFQHCQS